MSANDCPGCGKPIHDESLSIGGLHYHPNCFRIVPPPAHLFVLLALRLIAARAQANGREEITLGDIEWAIQEMEK